MQQVVYTASPESQQIHVWQLSAAGALTLLQVVDVDGQVQPMVAHPQKPLLYVGVRPEFRVIAYHIAADGTLSEAGEAALPGSPTYLNIDQQGHSLFAGYYHDGLVSVSPLDASGLPQAVAQTLSGMDGCHSVNIRQDNSVLYAPALKQDRICAFRLDSEGRLNENANAQVATVAGAGPRHMAFHPQGKYAYLVNELDSTVSVLALTEQGAETVQTLDMMPEDFEGTRWAADIHITPNGQFLYACDRTSSTLTLFRVSDDGATLTLGGFQATETQPRGFNIDTQGKYLIAAGQKSHHIEVYAISPQDGSLTPVNRYAVGQGPMWVVIRAL
ncbi:6-phosphogluconolactonase [Tatumella saanichensis]|uniref:6-phosphogluconolactonase n=1 Tax=Tatumella saanichensis TaxID=480813 RepID=UPI0004A495B4|nr:6-phosphogluconolactonase [Tatumella saanichensis]